MSHFTVLVVGDDPEQQLAPYQENNMGDCPMEYMEFVESEECNVDSATGKRGYWENPNCKWDWYRLGGRWSGMLKLKDEVMAAEDFGTVAVGSPGIMTDPAPRGYVDQALKGQIDFEGMREEAIAEAHKRYSAFEAALAAADVEIADHVHWSAFVKRVQAGRLTIDDARTEYHAQPLVKALHQARIFVYGNIEDEYFIGKGGREAYVKDAGESAAITFAVVKGGEWFERGQMGWWGHVANETDDDTWNQQFWELIRDLPDDTLLSVYDCHI